MLFTLPASMKKENHQHDERVHLNRVGLGARNIVEFGYIYLYTQDLNQARLETRPCQSKSEYDTVS